LQAPHCRLYAPKAVAHLDTMTQGNAALAEEYAASAETMTSRAGKLRRSIGVFVA